MRYVENIDAYLLAVPKELHNDIDKLFDAVKM